MTKHTCKHMMPRSPRHPVADLQCGANAKSRVLMHLGGEPFDACGVHANYWQRRGAEIQPIAQEETAP